MGQVDQPRAREPRDGAATTGAWRSHAEVVIPGEGLDSEPRPWWAQGPHRLFDDPQHRPLDVGDGLCVHSCQFVDELVVLRQESQVEVQTLLYGLLGPGRRHL